MNVMMDDEAILHTIRLAAEEEADIPPQLIQPADNASNIPGWDSLAHTRIVMNIEARLDIELDMDLTLQAATFGELVGLVRHAVSQRS